MKRYDLDLKLYEKEKGIYMLYSDFESNMIDLQNAYIKVISEKNELINKLENKIKIYEAQNGRQTD